MSNISLRAIDIEGERFSPRLITLNVIDNQFNGNGTDIFGHFNANVFATSNQFNNASNTSINWLFNYGSVLQVGSANNAAMANTFTNCNRQAIRCQVNTNANTEIRINHNTFIGEANSGAIYISEASNSAATINGSYKRLEITNNNIAFSRWGIRLDNVLGSQDRIPSYDMFQQRTPKLLLIDQTTLIQKNNISYNTGTFSWPNQNRIATEGVSGNNAQGITFIENTIHPLFYPANKSATRTTRNAAIRLTHGHKNMIYNNNLNGGEGIRNNFTAVDANIFCNTLDHYVNGFNFNRSALRNRNSGSTRQDRTHGWNDLPRHNNFSINGGGRTDIILENTSHAWMRWWFGPNDPFVRITPQTIPTNRNMVGFIKEGNTSKSPVCLRNSSGDSNTIYIWGITEDTLDSIDIETTFYNEWYDNYMQHIASIQLNEPPTEPNDFMYGMAQVEKFIAIDSLASAIELIDIVNPIHIYDVNYRKVIGIWLAANFPDRREFTLNEQDTLLQIATQSSLVSGPAATMARIYIKMALDTIIYEPEIEEQFGIGGWLEAAQCTPHYFANAQISFWGDNFQIDIAAIADSNGRFYVEPELLQSIDSDATFDLVIHTTSGSIYTMNKNQTLENWMMEPEIYLYKNCESAALVGLNKPLTGFEQIKAYPIPVTDVLNIIGLDTKMGYKIIITDVSGKELIKREFKGEYTAIMPTNMLDPGVYFTNITNAAGITKTIKFVK